MSKTVAVVLIASVAIAVVCTILDFTEISGKEAIGVSLLFTGFVFGSVLQYALHQFFKDK